ncbi:MAG: ACP S-malonyltransferase [Alphaproteobacteria bacterium]|nr:ACP S-malonyltransferase [Alphaproteobacteria bacterium]HPF46148.1 ACP S-malonyltransferase [Emcibacteraceae bacterium]HRW29760.1 ACP S-malonyltransferase [Emcibacteraceae bacterium]
MTRAFVFPGQGSQAVGMGKDLATSSAHARAVFQEVDDALGQKLSALMFEGPIEDLTLTYNAQPALMASSIAVVRVMENEFGLKIADLASFVAGHSLGEYSAHAAVGTISLSDTAKLLKLRGEAMQRAVPVGIGAMAAVMGAEFADVEEIAAEASQGQVCTAANDNADGQVVISGHKEAVERAMEIAKERGIKRAVLLPVSAPFHCPLMQPAADEMAVALNATTFNAPQIPVITNVSAKAQKDPEVLREQLIDQITGRVRWRESVLEMGTLGVSEIVELGTGKVLSGLVRRINKDISASSLQTLEDIEAFAKEIN